MGVVVSLLRGINLAGRNRIKMDALRTLYESLGLRNPQTYVQSGNVVFRTGQRDLTRLAMRIERGIEETFGFRTDVILRTPSELRQTVARNPFAGRPGIDPHRLLVTFLAADPGEAEWKPVLAIQAGPEELRRGEREFYIYYPAGLARPKLLWTVIAERLKARGTGRNWNTVTKLLEIAESMEAPSGH